VKKKQRPESVRAWGYEWETPDGEWSLACRFRLVRKTVVSEMAAITKLNGVRRRVVPVWIVRRRKP